MFALNYCSPSTNLHRMPKDLTMVHPLVDGQVQGHGIYQSCISEKPQCCMERDGFSFDPLTGKPNAWNVTCQEDRSCVKCLFASLRDLNSCRPGTNNIFNSLNVDIFVGPSHKCANSGEQSDWNRLLDLKGTSGPRRYGDFHGWQVPLPVHPLPSLMADSTKFNLVKSKNFDVNAATSDAWVWNQNAGMMDVPVIAMPNEYEDVLQPNDGCKNVESTIYKQDAKFDGRWYSRRDSRSDMRLREKLAGMSQIAAEVDANAQRVLKGARPHSPTTGGGIVEMAYDVGIEAGYAKAMNHAMVFIVLGISVVCVRLRLCGFKALRKFRNDRDSSV
jgi:hypothetical protein